MKKPSPSSAFLAAPELLAACEAAYESEQCVCKEIEATHPTKCLACVLEEAIKKAYEPCDLTSRDIAKLLDPQEQIAIVWSAEDVLDVRPHLSVEQAWEVLQHARDKHDADMGISWDTLRIYADDMYPIKKV